MLWLLLPSLVLLNCRLPSVYDCSYYILMSVTWLWWWDVWELVLIRREEYFTNIYLIVSSSSSPLSSPACGSIVTAQQAVTAFPAAVVPTTPVSNESQVQTSPSRFQWRMCRRSEYSQTWPWFFVRHCSTEHESNSINASGHEFLFLPVLSKWSILVLYPASWKILALWISRKKARVINFYFVKGIRIVIT